MTDEEQKLYCHDCDNYIRFKPKKGKSGNLIIVCPHCGHQHCRVVENGEVTSDRWEGRSERLDKEKYGVNRND